MSFLFTPQMEKRITPRVHRMLEVALRRFPELQGKTITVGYTRANLGTAMIPIGPQSEAEMGIRLNVRNLTYNTIGHELTHLAQGLSQHSKKAARKSRRAALGKIPGGETQCDIWTLARSDLFCDDAPVYLKLPRNIRRDWPRYARSVRALCIAAIEKRQTYRLYIRWLESQIKELSRQSFAENAEDLQLHLPFVC
ncbi:MAG TPA: hypothetical protein VJM80_07140 [bacterium]|nr:hypothetical protein [bacterium]